MKKRLFLYTMLIFFAGTACFFAASVYMTYGGNMEIAKDTAMETARICAALYAETDVFSFVKAGGDTRITVVSRDGRVLADSSPLDIEAMENHLERPEIRAAADGSPEAFVRRSATLGADYIYCAQKAGSGDDYVFIRVAIPAAKIDAYLYKTLPIFAVLTLAVVLICFVFSRGMIDRITKPLGSVVDRLRLLSEGGYPSAPSGGGYEEIDAIIKGIDEVALILKETIGGLRDEKIKLDYVMKNIGDGIFVLDGEKNISLINPAALGVFNAGTEINGKNLNYLSGDKHFVDTVNNCADRGEDALFEMSAGGRIFLASVKRLPEAALTMAVLSDVTENRENAKRREEFFANASHELKTPLAAVKGFAELTAINNKDENIEKYIAGIGRETGRMTSLIESMLKLSELEAKHDFDPAPASKPVSLLKTVNEACETLSAAAEKNEISINIEGDGVIEAEPGHVYELIKNIVDNAVRYNNRGGGVAIKIKTEKKIPRLVVSDDGTGISPEDQSRIFERFYRAEKSRSLRSGGTGLGLSIVKHICALYGWKVSLKSRLGAGTEVTVVFGPEN